jgi:hypothetical protein
MKLHLGIVPFNYQLVKEITRENRVRLLFENSDGYSVLCSGTKNKDAPGALPRHYGAPVAMAVYNQESGILVIQMNRMHPCPKKGAGLIARGASIKTRNRSLEYDCTLKFFCCNHNSQQPLPPLPLLTASPLYREYWAGSGQARAFS